jgi:hypothetical protein
VAGQLPETENKALLHLLSASPDQVRYGVAHYQQHSADTSTLLGQLFEGYEREGLTMPYTMQDFRRDYVKEHLKDLTLKERLEGLSAEELLEGLSPDERLRLERYLQGLRPQGTAPKRKKKK